jgi:hypothetical protein
MEMNQAGQRNRPRTLRHAAPERVREMLHAYRRRATRDAPRTGADSKPVAPNRGSSAR